VAKILVADDNSNVQKTVTLALADLGVEVVSVNNGEAAVRKLADMSPDLVLADIFMPVRNGYEVCEYVKNDPRFAHVPVVLLVGAFDPLDEREAQRVGADGILKKPFVPPDPLITMVKSLLDRSTSERLVAVPASTPPVAAQIKSSNGAVAETKVAPPILPDEPSSEEFAVKAGRVSFGEGDRPVAFGQLLDTPASGSATKTDVIEPVDDEQILTNSRDATLGEPSFWRNDSTEVDPEAEQSAASQADISLRKWQEDQDSLPRREDAALLRPIEPLELIREEPLDDPPSDVDSEPVVLDPAAQSPLTVESGKAPELAANPMEWLATAPAQHQDEAPETSVGWGELKREDPQASVEALSSKTEPESFLSGLQVEPVPVTNNFEATEVAEHSAETEVAPEMDTQTASALTVKDSPQVPLAPQAPEDTARSVPIRKWAEMTDSLDDGAHVPSPIQNMPQPSAAIHLEPSKSAASANLKEYFNKAVTPEPMPPVSLPESSSVTPAGPDPALVEAVVLRVLDKMRPQVVDIITKEFLRPVVQALVLREIEKQ
jgi:CheY-like chemotaxis protein